MKIVGICYPYPCQTVVGVVKDGPSSSDVRNEYLLNNSGMLKNKKLDLPIVWYDLTISILA